MPMKALLCLLHLFAMAEEGWRASGACDSPQASDAFASIQVKKAAESHGDPKKIMGGDARRYENGTVEVDIVYEDGTVEVAQVYVNGTLVVDNAPALLQDLE